MRIITSSSFAAIVVGRGGGGGGGGGHDDAILYASSSSSFSFSLERAHGEKSESFLESFGNAHVFFRPLLFLKP